MNNITEKYGYVAKRIPDPQVKDTADQFWTAADLLRAQPPGTGVSTPAIINGVLAIELYLKTVLAKSVIKDLKDYGNSEGGIVTVHSEKRTHCLSALYDVADEWVRTELDLGYSKSTLYQKGTTLRDLLQRYDDVFVKVRYIHEYYASFRNLNIPELHQLAQLMKGAVEALPRTKTKHEK